MNTPSNNLTRKTLLAAALAAGAVVLSPDMLSAAPARSASGARVIQRSGGGGSTSGRNSAADAVMQDVRDAQREIARVIGELRRAFDSSPELADARASLRDATTAYQRVQAEALTTTRDGADYKRAAIEVERAQRRLDAARSAFAKDQKVTSAAIEQVARELMSARSAVSKLEAAALSADESVAAARYAFIDANGKVVAKRRELERSIQSNEQFLDARRRLNEARRRLAGMSR